MNNARSRGFTLIELSIVLVIIGLLVGGVLVGVDLIKSAEVRAQISQVEKFNTAKNTFYAKYQALPGDMNATTASQFGFATRSGLLGEGDGNGLLQDCNGTSTAVSCGELSGFWEDLSNSTTGNLIEGAFNTASFNSGPPATVPATGVALYLPRAKIGSNNYIYTYSGGASASDNINYFGLSTVTQLSNIISQPLLSAGQAYAIDAKTDDGLPQSGKVLAIYKPSGGPISWVGAASTSATPETTSTCYDNGNVSGATQQYSLGSLASYGVGPNCALSFQFQ